jgi:tetratricopeptide (TPR) repeat protein
MTRPPNIPQHRLFSNSKQKQAKLMIIDKLFDKGHDLHQRGQLIEAKKIFEEVLLKNPHHTGAISLLGIIAAQTKNPSLALRFFNTLITIDPHLASAYFNKGNALKELMLFEEAIECFKHAIKKKPDYIQAHYNCGNTLQKLDRLDESIISYTNAILINPEHLAARYNRANSLTKLKRYKEASDDYKYVISKKSDFTEAYNNYGLLLVEIKQFEDALNCFNKALEINPSYAQAYSNRGNLYCEINQLKYALEDLELAIKINPQVAEFHSNLGNNLIKLGLLNDALFSYQQAIELDNTDAKSLTNLGFVLEKLKRFDESLVNYNRAIELKSDYAEAYFNKSLLLLSLQEFKNGWDLYDWRWKSDIFNSTYLSSSKPKLTSFGSARNKKLLIWGEQGIGDQILYTSMLNELLNIYPSSQISLDRRLLPLLNRSFPHGKFIDNTTAIENIDYDEHIPIADLGKYFRTCSSDFDSVRYHYLLADQQRAKKIRDSLITNNKYLCGITWNSKVKTTGVEKSIELEDLLPILSLENIAFVSLQYGNVQNKLAEFNKKHDKNILECNSVDNFYDLDGHAALIEACDFIITISNSSAHMAGAIGKETYLLCPSGKGLLWYWSNRINGNSLWYPRIHIYEQNSPGQWVDVVQNVKLVIEKKMYELE